jgi:nucleoside-diphosphate-sugar epimerase
MKDLSELDEQALEDILSEPTDATRKAVAGLQGDIAVLGAGGKMGPTLAMMLKKASSGKNIYAASRFTNIAVRRRIENAAIKTIEIDLLDESQYCKLPDVENVFYLLGMKFGVTDNSASGGLTLRQAQGTLWALNSLVPALVARYYRNARIVVFSTGNVYPFVDINSGGAQETTTAAPVGEYAQSCLGRERMFEYFSSLYDTLVTIVRLNYSNEPRYGIIVDVTTKILNDEPIDVTMGTVNLIWQRDANDYIIRAMTLAESPPTMLNVTGPGTIMIRQLAEQIGKHLGKRPKFVSQESQTALLSDASYCFKLFGYPQTTLEEMVAMITRWVASGKRTLNKPTKYDIRDGKF